VVALQDGEFDQVYERSEDNLILFFNDKRDKVGELKRSRFSPSFMMWTGIPEGATHLDFVESDTYERNCHSFRSSRKCFDCSSKREEDCLQGFFTRLTFCDDTCFDPEIYADEGPSYFKDYDFQGTIFEVVEHSPEMKKTERVYPYMCDIRIPTQATCVAIENDTNYNSTDKETREGVPVNVVIAFRKPDSQYKFAAYHELKKIAFKAERHKCMFRIPETARTMSINICPPCEEDSDSPRIHSFDEKNKCKTCE
jgi:hypothetical protein